MMGGEERGRPPSDRGGRPRNKTMRESYLCGHVRRKRLSQISRRIRDVGVDALLDEARFEVHDTSGVERIIDCPHCNEPEHYDLWVNGETGLWICYRCGEAGSLPGLLAEGLGISYGEAVAWLLEEEMRDLRAAEAREVFDDLLADLEEEDETRRVDLPREAMPIREGSRPWRYLLGRGLEPETIREFDVRWCRTGPLAGRIVFPVVGLEGEQFSYTARTLRKGVQPKYRHPPGVPIRRTMYGRAKGDSVVLVEGVLDALMWIQQGVPAMALHGAGPSRWQLPEVIRRWSTVTLAFDGDEAGRQATEDAIDALFGLVSLRVVRLPDGADPGSVDADEYLPGGRIVPRRERLGGILDAIAGGGP